MFKNPNCVCVLLKGILGFSATVNRAVLYFWTSLCLIRFDVLDCFNPPQKRNEAKTLNNSKKGFLSHLALHNQPECRLFKAPLQQRLQLRSTAVSNSIINEVMAFYSSSVPCVTKPSEACFVPYSPDILLQSN